MTAPAAGGDNRIESRKNYGGEADSYNGGYTRTADDLPPGDYAGWGRRAAAMSSGKNKETQNEEDEHSGREDGDDFLLQQARNIYRASTDYIEANIASGWERNLAHFHNEHASGTHYRKLGFKRSRSFRPMTRANVKSQEAAASVAVFSTQDMVTVDPQNATNPLQKVAADALKYLLEWRLEEKMPWFQTVMGAFQDTKNYGICASHQYWDYHEDTDVVPAYNDDGSPLIDEDTGAPMGEEVTRVRRDELACDNLPPENVRFSPHCDWRNPVRTSPYVIVMKPMVVGDVEEMMEKVDPKTRQPVWRKYSRAQILTAKDNSIDRTRQAREGNRRQDPQQQAQVAGDEYTTVFAHMNIVRVNGEDLVFWTLGTELVLTRPQRLRDVEPWLEEGERPVVIGTTVIETHRSYPAGDVEQGAGLQEELNTIVNQRIDNVKLVLNKRYHVRRGGQVDLDALIRNVPGGGVMMNDIEKDVKVISTDDVTGSSYQEQDRISVEHDALVGSMGQASVMSNRKLNETVGGMGMISQSANSVQDYGIRIFLVTWMLPVLRQLVRLIQMYETDSAQLSLAAEYVDALKYIGTNRIDSTEFDELMMQTLMVKINVGMGNTDPVRRVERVTFGVEQAASLPGMAGRLKSEKIAHEIFGALGYRDGRMFIRSDEEQRRYEEENPPPKDPEVELRERELEIRREDNQMRNEREERKLSEEIRLRYADLAFKYDTSIDNIIMKMESERLKDKTTRDVAAANVAAKREEMQLRRSTGAGV